MPATHLVSSEIITNNNVHDYAIISATQEADNLYSVPVEEMRRILDGAQAGSCVLLSLMAVPSENIRSLADERILYNPIAHTVHVDGSLTEFTPVEFKLMDLFASNADITLRKEAILSAVWGTASAYIASSALRVHVNRLRNKLGPELGNPAEGAIRTVPHTGYEALSSLG